MSWKQTDDHMLRKTCAAVPVSCFRKQRWFSHRDGRSDLKLVETLLFTTEELAETFISLNLFSFESDLFEFFYFIPLLITKDTRPEPILFSRGDYLFFDAVPTGEYISLISQCFQEELTLRTGLGRFIFHTIEKFPEIHFHLHGTSSNSLLFVSNQMLIKNYRLIFKGINPELEVNQVLTEMGSNLIPKIYGYLEYRLGSGSVFTLLLTQEMIENEGTGWEVWKDLISKFSSGDEKELSEQAAALGETLARLHRELAEMSRKFQQYHPLAVGAIQSKITDLEKMLNGDLAEYLKDETGRVVDRLHQLQRILDKADLGLSFRIHGDLHLEQVLKTPGGWKVIDFEGEPLKSITERGNYDSPLKDIASMLRSISYRVYSLGISDGDACENAIRQKMTEGYLNAYERFGEDFLPVPEVSACLLELFQWERVLYEYNYELKYRPDWLHIPEHGLRGLLNQN